MAMNTNRPLWGEKVSPFNEHTKAYWAQWNTQESLSIGGVGVRDTCLTDIYSPNGCIWGDTGGCSSGVHGRGAHL